MKDSERIQKLAAKLAGRKDGLEIVRKMKCGGKKYPGGGKFFRTSLPNEAPLMYEPMITIDYPIVSPLRFRPQPDLGDYQAPASTGMAVDYPITAPGEAPLVVAESTPAPVVVEAPVENLFTDEMIARRALKQRYAESAFNDKAKSKAGAQGAWQIMPITLKDYLGRGRGKSGDLNDPEYNRKVRDWVMGIIPRDLKEFWSDSDTDRAKLAKLYAAYNWGAGNLRSFLRKKQKAGVDISNPDNWVDDLNPETRRYVKYLAFDEDIPDSTVYTNAAFERAAAERGYASGGRIHIKPENRGKFTALKKRTGHSASWFKAHGTPAQKKMAVFALNSRKWKHGDGGFINKYDGETESTGLMQRTPNWVVRGQDYSEWKPSDIQDIINWGYTDPEAFFSQEGQSTRDALSRAGMADSVIGDIYRNAPVELQARLGDRYMGTAQRQDEYNQGIRDYTNYVAPRLGAAMAGSLLGAEGLSVAAPWLVDVAAPAIQRAANSTIGRRIRGGLDVLGTIDGIRNSLSDNGLRKTYRLLGEGRYGRAALSALGDAFDVAGGVGYLKGVGKRGAEAILRMGDAARSSGTLFRAALDDANYLGMTGLKKYAHVPKYIKSQHSMRGNTSRQLLDRNTLEYIFNPMANPDLAYQMPLNYSGDNNDPWQKGRHKYDRIDEFLGKTQPENVEYVNVEDLPANIREWAEDRYPGMKQIRVAHIGKTTDRVSHIDREIRSMKPGDTIENLRRSSTGLPDEAGIDMLDPGHHGVDLVADEDGTIRAFGNDVYKYNEKDWLKKWKSDFNGKVKKDGEVDKPKTFLQEYLDKEYGDGYSDMSLLGKLKYHGLRFIDRQGSPIIYNWDYGTIGHVPSYNMNPSTYVPSGAPDLDSTIAEIDDWIAKKKKAMMFTSDIDEMDALNKDIQHGEMLKKMKEPVTPPSPYENYWADSDIDDVDFDIPDMSTFKSPEVDSEIGTFTDWMEADAAKEAAKEAAAQKHQDALDKLNDTSWINLDEINNPKPKATQAKKAVKKMTDEEVKALQDEITKQVKETYEKMKASKAKKTSSYNHAPHSNGTNPEDAELPWAYGGLLNRMSKFYNNDRSSMLNLVRKVKAGKN